jgi:hypothetical protein
MNPVSVQASEQCAMEKERGVVAAQLPQEEHK